jgi:hypothetical protein
LPPLGRRRTAPTAPGTGGADLCHALDEALRRHVHGSLAVLGFPGALASTLLPKSLREAAQHTPTRTQREC